MKVSAWVAEHAAAIELFYLPSCSPELSPDVMAIADTGPRTHQAALCGLCGDTNMLN